MPDYLYAVLFTGVGFAIGYIVLSRTKFKLLAFITRVIVSALAIVLAVLSAYAVWGGLNLKSTLSIIFVLVAVILYVLNDILQAVVVDFKTKISSKMVKYIDFCLNILANVLVFVSLVLIFGFSYYTLIWFCILAGVFYYVNTLLYKAGYGKNLPFVIAYDCVLSLTLSQAISSLAFGSYHTNIALFIMLAFLFFYIADFFKYGRLYIANQDMKKDEVMDIFGLAMHYAGVLLTAMSVVFIFF